MRILLIEKRIQIVNILQSRCKDIIVYNGDYTKPLITIVQDIKNRYADTIDVYMIDVNMHIGDALLSENSGIKILKLLRLNDINNHVILYSWLSKDMLVAHQYNTIIFSKGVSFYRLPEFTEKVSELNFDKLSLVQADERELRHLFSIEYRLKDRHHNANYYGVGQMMKTYLFLLENSEIQGLMQSLDSGPFNEVLGYLNTYMGKIIQYISREDGASETMVDRDICERISNQINNLRKRKRHPLILYVDDMASVGWKDLLSHILFGEMNSRNLRTVYFSQEHSPEEIANNIMNAGLKKADLLILDLRLKDEKGFVRPSELSGMKVLRRLEKNGSLCCPVMIFTASNKIWSLKEAFRNNVVSYYIKEGLDYSDDDMSMHSFLNLIEQINFLTAYSWIFKLLSKLRKMSATIRFEKGSFWWETLRASYTARSKNIKKTFHRKLTQKKDICIILNKVIESVQRDVRAICFFENYLNVSDVLCSMIVKLAGVLEEIHTSVDGDEPHTLCFKMKAHLPNIETSKYIDIRNTAVHNRNIESFLNDMSEYVNNFMDYLILKPIKSDVQRFYEEEITPIDDRLNKLMNYEDIIVELDGAGINGTLLGPKEHGYFYNFVIAIKNERAQLIGVRSNRVLENIGKGDLICVRRVKIEGETDVPPEKMTLEIIL